MNRFTQESFIYTNESQPKKKKKKTKPSNNNNKMVAEGSKR